MAKPTYLELADFAESNNFALRVTHAVVLYARFIINEPTNTANHQRRNNFAVQAIQNPRGIVAGLLQAIAADSAFADQDPPALDATPDATLQAAVEATLNSTILAF